MAVYKSAEPDPLVFKRGVVSGGRSWSRVTNTLCNSYFFLYYICAYTPVTLSALTRADLALSL